MVDKITITRNRKGSNPGALPDEEGYRNLVSFYVDGHLVAITEDRVEAMAHAFGSCLIHWELT